MTLYRSSQNSFVIFYSNIQQPSCVMREIVKMTLGRVEKFSSLVGSLCMFLHLNIDDKVATN